MSYETRFTRVALKDIKSLSPKLKKKLKEIVINQLAQDPYSGKRLVGDLTGFYSIRLSYKDRVVYSIDEENQVIYIHRARTHYGD